MQENLSFKELSDRIHSSGEAAFIVSGKTFYKSKISERLNLSNSKVKVYRFSDFTENPCFEEVEKGIDLFRRSGVKNIIAIGGGTAIDLAKLIKYYANAETLCVDSDLPIVSEIDSSITITAIPTTFGTGSESTHFAVLYFNKRKYSIAHESLLPESILIDSSLSSTLPISTKGSACLDALCQSIESLWCKGSTIESRSYAKDSIIRIVKNFDRYISDPIPHVQSEIALAANLSGRAINITKTTAPHALSYSLTSKYQIPHGHAVALCIRNMFEINTRKLTCGIAERDVMGEVYSVLGVEDAGDAKRLIVHFMKIAGLEVDLKFLGLLNTDIDFIVKSVNLERLNNHPIYLDEDDLRRMLES